MSEASITGRCMVVKVMAIGGERHWRIVPGAKLMNWPEAEVEMLAQARQYPNDDFAVIGEMAVLERRETLAAKQTAAFVREGQVAVPVVKMAVKR